MHLYIYIIMESILQKNIKERLEKKKISVAELERRIGLRHAVINIMHGRSKNPSIRVAQAIAKELECSMEDLLSNDNNAAIQEQVVFNQHISLEDDKENYHELKELSKQWDPLLAKQALEALNKYLTDNKLNPQHTEIFQCMDEIYRYSYNNAKQIDFLFVNWIAERFFIRKLK